MSLVTQSVFANGLLYFNDFLHSLFVPSLWPNVQKSFAAFELVNFIQGHVCIMVYYQMSSIWIFYYVKVYFKQFHSYKSKPILTDV